MLSSNAVSRQIGLNVLLGGIRNSVRFEISGICLWFVLKLPSTKKQTSCFLYFLSFFDMDLRFALQTAVDLNLENHVLRLLQSGINLKENNFGTDLILRAVRLVNCERIIDHLLDYGAEANHEVLVSAIRRYDEIIIEKLLNHGANAKETDWLNRNALHSAVRFNGKNKVCEVLIKYGAEVNQESISCRITPFFNAIDDYTSCRNSENIAILLKYGAQPLKEFDGPMGRGCPFQYIFDLPVSDIENIVKYTSLQVNHNSVSKFLAHFKGDKSINKKSRFYLQLATNCLEEVGVLKQHWIINQESTLFDFAVSQGSTYDYFQSKSSVVNQVFTQLSFKLFPIYSEIILKKFKRVTLVAKVSEFSCLKWNANSQDKNVCLDTYSVEYICKFLPFEDLRNLFLSFAF